MVFLRRLGSMVAALATLFSTHTSAATYAAGIENSQWYLSASIFECSLTHTIPHFGKGVFFHEAGEPLAFYLDALSNPMRPGKAALVIEAPDWRPGAQVGNMGYVPVSQGARPVALGNKQSRTIMQGLLDGMMPTFTRKAWYGDESVRVRVSSINFERIYQDYLSCVAGLLPVNFRQVERTKVLFEVDKAVLTASDIKKLDNIVLYVNADKTVTGIFVDGHTDSSGRRIYNRRLSKNRAEVVTRYLIDNGVSETMITTRYHGERYPVLPNKNASNKAQNRRTTVRLERGNKQTPDLELVENGAAPGEA